jgi:hypothetical protein
MFESIVVDVLQLVGLEIPDKLPERPRIILPPAKPLFEQVVKQLDQRVTTALVQLQAGVIRPPDVHGLDGTAVSVAVVL